MIELGVNIDHVATVRQARRTDEPDPAAAAFEAQLGGADCITVHLREDRRHILDRDLHLLAEVVTVRLNLEMAATEEMVAIAGQTRPQMVTLVPEGRREITTEGGLDVAATASSMTDVVARLHEAVGVVSAFVDAHDAQIDAARACGFDACEIHTGPYGHSFADRGRDAAAAPIAAEIDRIAHCGQRIEQAGMRFHAGHALTYANVQPIAALAGLRELHIGHSIVSRAVFVGLRQAVAEMKRLMREAASAR